MGDVAIEVERCLEAASGSTTSGYSSLKERGPAWSVAARYEDFWAVSDADLRPSHQGEIGRPCIGHNGSGKSHACSSASLGILPTDHGRDRHVNGRLAALLEVGTGFHPELTGRENIFLNGSILGMKRR